MSKKGFEMPFAWLFAIIVGGVILFLAIYASTKIISTEQTQIDAETAKEIGILLNPIETGFETGKKNSLTLPQETRIYNRCNTENEFGRQIIKISQNSFGKWTDTDVDVGFSNKYIFSKEYAEGKTFFLFSKPFEFPFKITDVIYLTSANDKYCFIDAPENVKEELADLNEENIKTESCSTDEESVKICFSSSNPTGCDIRVNYGAGYTEKNGERMYFYSDSLMYASIFSDKIIYECQVKRIMQRAEQLSLLYSDKGEFVSGEQCNSNIGNELAELAGIEGSFASSDNLNNYMINLAENIGKKNSLTECKLW